MALLFVGGVMNLIWIAGLTIFVLLEKIVPTGRLVSYLSGAGLAAWGRLAADRDSMTGLRSWVHELGASSAPED
jgi:predicted metal-binding membrane protein